MIEKDPGLVEDEQRRPPVEPLFEPVEQIGQHRRDDARLPHQRFGLEALHVGDGEIVLGGIEHPPERAFERIRRERACAVKPTGAGARGRSASAPRSARVARLVSADQMRLLDLRGDSLPVRERAAPRSTPPPRRARRPGRFLRSGWKAIAPSLARPANGQARDARRPSRAPRRAPEKPLSKI